VEALPKAILAAWDRFTTHDDFRPDVVPSAVVKGLFDKVGLGGGGRTKLGLLRWWLKVRNPGETIECSHF
jgi:hypothetical protein